MAIRDRAWSLACALGAITALGAACTVFDGKTLPADLTSADGGPTTEPVQIASGAARYLALDADTVYFTSPSAGAVLRVAKTGGSAVTVVGGQGDPGAISVDGANVFWANGTPPSILTCAVGGCASAKELATTTTFPYGLTSDATSVYWLVSDARGSLEKVDQNGTGRQTLASNQGYAQWIAVDATNVYFTNAGDGTVNRYGKTDKALMRLAEGESAPHGIAIDETNVYFTVHDSGLVKRVSKAGDGLTVLARGQATPEGLATDGTNLYWANRGVGENDGSIQRCSVMGGPVTPLASRQAQPFGVAVDGAEVFWVNAGNGALMKAKK